MKKVILTIAVGMMTMVGFGQNYEYIKVIPTSKPDMECLEVMNTIFKPDSLKSHDDYVRIKKFFKNKLNKTYTTVFTTVKNNYADNTLYKDFLKTDTFVFSMGEFKKEYNGLIVVSAEKDTLLITFGDQKSNVHFRIFFKEKIMTFNLISVS